MQDTIHQDNAKTHSATQTHSICVSDTQHLQKHTDTQHLCVRHTSSAQYVVDTTFSFFQKRNKKIVFGTLMVHIVQVFYHDVNQVQLNEH